MRRQNLALPRERPPTSPPSPNWASGKRRPIVARKTRSLEGLVENTLRISEYCFQHYYSHPVALRLSMAP